MSRRFLIRGGGLAMAMCLGCAIGLAAEGPFPARKGDVPTAGLYVPVRLDPYAADRVGIEFSSRHVVVAGVPFDLAGTPSADNVFLKSAEWPDWQEDPSSYYAAYDKGPEVPGRSSPADVQGAGGGLRGRVPAGGGRQRSRPVERDQLSHRRDGRAATYGAARLLGGRCRALTGQTRRRDSGRLSCRRRAICS